MFAHTLARDMGRVDVDVMMDEISLPDFLRWMAYYETGEPLMPEAFTLAGIGNMMGSKKPLTAGDMLGRKRQQSAASQKAVFMAFFQEHNKAVKRGKP